MGPVLRGALSSERENWTRLGEIEGNLANVGQPQRSQTEARTEDAVYLPEGFMINLSLSPVLACFPLGDYFPASLPGHPVSIPGCITPLFRPQASWQDPPTHPRSTLILPYGNHREPWGSPPMRWPKSILIGSHDRIKCFCCNIVSIKGIVIFKM